MLLNIHKKLFLCRIIKQIPECESSKTEVCEFLSLIIIIIQNIVVLTLISIDEYQPQVKQDNCIH